MPYSPAKSFVDLIVWQKAHAFVLRVYAFSATFPKSEVFGLSQQLRRCAVSVPANIVEGFRRRGRRDKAKFFNIAEASLEEARYHLMLARDLNYGHDPTLEPAIDEISRMLSAYIRTLRTRPPARSSLLPPNS